MSEKIGKGYSAYLKSMSEAVRSGMDEAEKIAEAVEVAVKKRSGSSDESRAIDEYIPVVLQLLKDEDPSKVPHLVEALGKAVKEEIGLAKCLDILKRMESLELLTRQGGSVSLTALGKAFTEDD